ncbi:trypsin-like serine peptidase [Peredibacter starrii]|uniref:Serine protease n=1 Tax=Peredibacter starrii TaxID=28202 RepID=A0AAX4HJ27_9BACT|nr:serine protease [Peredibacter starrii]WPU63241.1 serine protease [Peredibacter starrii]
MRLLAVMAILGLSFEAFAGSSYFQPLDVKSLHDFEVQREKKGEAPRFAVPHKVSIKPSWEKAKGGYVWTHQVTAPNAVSLNFGFSKFNLPEGAELNIYSADRSEFIRPFTSADNNAAKELWTPVIMSDDVIIEVSAPAEVVGQVEIELGQVGQGFRTFGQSTQKAGSCNIDVACTESRGWEQEVNSVGVISTGGSTFCTGFMVNNTNNDKTPFFMTANHCRINAGAAPSLVVYWNYQTSKCGGARDGKMTDFQTGSVLLATGTKSDFTLVRLNSQPRPEWNVNFAGWDATETGHDSPSTAIHHPNVDEKSISFDNDRAVLSSYSGQSSPGDGTHVRVIDWDKGTTEPGSSGSPLFNSSHRVVGQLHGGGAACGNDLSDYYGRLNTSWKGDGTKGGSLKDHLDPNKTGRMVTDTI